MSTQRRPVISVRARQKIQHSISFLAESLEARIFLSGTAGTFPTIPATYGIGQGSDCYPAVGVFTSNGLPDIAVANDSLSGQNGSISVLLNNGNGTFAAAKTLSAGERPFQVITGQFTSSGHTDLVVTNSEDGTVGFYAGDGNGNFANPVLSTYGTQAASGSGALAYLAAVKLDGPGGNLDLVVADQNDNELITLINNGSGSFSVGQVIHGDFDSIVTGAFLDDGNTDIATTSSNGNIIHVYQNLGNGMLSPTPVQLSTNALGGSQGGGLVAGDFNGDGKTDLGLLTATETSDTDTLSVFLNQGNGTFSSPIATSIQNADDLAVGDFNNDGKLDIVTTDSANIVVYPGTGDGTFQSTPTLNLQNFGMLGGPVVADVNGDSLPDIIADGALANANTIGPVISVFINGGSNSSGGGSGGGGGGGGGTATLTPSIAGKLPASVIAGQKATLNQTVTLIDSGANYDASATVQLYLSTGTTIDSNSIALPARSSKFLKIEVGKHASLKFNLKSLPTSVPNGTYHIVAQVTDSSGNITSAASSSTVTVAPAEIDLTGSFAGTPAPARKGATHVTFTVTNDGNTPATGPLSFAIDDSADGLLSDATNLLNPSKAINLKPGKSTKITVPVTLPAGSYYLVVDLDPSDAFHDINLANNVFATSGKVTVS